jgi:cytochrome P450
MRRDMIVRDIPVVPGRAFTGNMREMDGDAHLFALDVSRRYGDLARLRLFWREALLVSSPALFREVFVEKAKHFEKATALRVLFFPVLGNGLLTAPWEPWRKQRKRMAPIFHHQQLTHHARCIAEETGRGVAAWQDGMQLEVAKEMTRITTSVVCRALFGVDAFAESEDLGEAMRAALGWIGAQGVTPGLVGRILAIEALSRTSKKPGARAGWIERLLYLPPLWPTAKNRRFRETMERIERRLRDMIEARRAAGGAGEDLLATLVRAQDEDGSTMSDRQVMDEALTIFFGGQETTANALTWALYLLSQNPEAEAKLHAEADGMPDDRALTFDDLRRLPYALQVFKEAVRLYPSAPVINRECREPVEIGGHRVQKGTLVFASPYAMHRREDIWPEPERFLPERFAPEAEAARPSHSFIPFGSGPRLCIGNHFALMEGQIVLASIARRFRLALEPGHQPRAKPAPTLHSANGMPMRVQRR